MPGHLLDLGTAYVLFQRAIGSRTVREYLVEHYISPTPGERVLDFACGTGNILPFLPPVDYVGIDSNRDYIALASAQYGDRGRFIHQSALDPLPRGIPEFDVVIGFGILHHLPDAACVTLFRRAAEAIRPRGRFVTLDGCYRNGQHPLAYWLNRFDRGKFVRTLEAYAELARTSFERVTPYDYCGKIRTPADHCVLVCEN